MEEYKILNSQVSSLVAETRRLETYTAVSVAALFAWFVTNHLPYGMAWYIPVMVPILTGLRAFALYVRMGQLAAYLRNLERVFLNEHDVPSGLENYLSTIYGHAGSSNPVAGKSYSKVSPQAMIFWALMLIVTLVAPTVLKDLPQPAQHTAQTDRA